MALLRAAGSRLTWIAVRTGGRWQLLSQTLARMPEAPRSARYTAADLVSRQSLARWLAKARDIQWDYKNLVRRKGQLERLV